MTHPRLEDAARYHALSTSPEAGPVFNRLIGIPLANLVVPQGLVRAFSPQPVPPNYIETSELPLLYREETFRSNFQDIVAADMFLKKQALRYGQMRVPVIAITGDRDAFVSPLNHSLAIAREAPSARLIVLPGVGHMPHHARPDMIAESAKGLIVQP